MLVLANAHFDFNGYIETGNAKPAQSGRREDRGGELPNEIEALSLSAMDMKRFWVTIFLALVIVGGSWILLNQDRIKQSGGLTTFLGQQLRSNGSNQNGAGFNSSAGFNNGFNSSQNGPFRQASNPQSISNSYAAQNGSGFQNRSAPNRIRIASFKLAGSASQANPEMAKGIVANICLRNDLIAFQEVDGHRPGWLDELTAEIARQSNGRAIYKHASDHVRVARNEPQYAFVYNAATLDLDMGHTYTVADPDNILVREPLVGWFRTRLVSQNEAFTFTVANIQLDRKHPGNEIAYLGNLYDAIRRDGRGEDDVIFVGDFKSGDRALKNAQRKFGMTWVVSDQATNTMNDAQYDNLVFNQMATLEFTGNGGVIDFLKFYNLGFRDAMSISEHMPVWAEFSASEKVR